MAAVWCVQEEALEESGWKLVHGDVFRPPIYRRLLVALTGAGIQIFMSTFIVIGNWNIDKKGQLSLTNPRNACKTFARFM